MEKVALQQSLDIVETIFGSNRGDYQLFLPAREILGNERVKAEVAGIFQDMILQNRMSPENHLHGFNRFSRPSFEDGKGIHQEIYFGSFSKADEANLGYQLGWDNHALRIQIHGTRIRLFEDRVIFTVLDKTIELGEKV